MQTVRAVRFKSQNPNLLRNYRIMWSQKPGERGHRASLSTMGKWMNNHFRTCPWVSGVLTGRGPRSLGFKGAFDRMCTGNFRRGSSCKKNLKAEVLRVTICVRLLAPPLWSCGGLCMEPHSGLRRGGEGRVSSLCRKPGWISLSKNIPLCLLLVLSKRRRVRTFK